MNDHLLSQAHTFATEPLALAALSFLLALFALILAAITPSKIEGAHSSAMEFRRRQLDALGKLGGKLTEYEGFVRKRNVAAGQQAVDLRQADSRQADSRQADSPPPTVTAISEPPEPAPPELTPLEKDRADITDFLAELLSSFEGWADLAGFSLDATVDVRSQIAGVRALVQPPADEEALRIAVNDRLVPLIAEAVKIVLSRTDRDCDPERKNTRLQQHIDQFLRMPKLRKKLALIDPAVGEPIDFQVHKTLQLVAGEPLERGCVAATKVRGLKWNDQVVLKAEVVEYD